MTHEQLRDELAGLMGWEDYFDPDEGAGWLGPGGATTQHPVPPTLDAVSAMLPPGWMWRGINQHSDGWYASAMNGAMTVNWTQTTTELESRLRCCVAAWRAYKMKGTM